jgi:osmotically-inducible protein OsmY
MGHLSAESFSASAIAAAIQHSVQLPKQLELMAERRPLEDDRIKCAVMTALQWDLAVPRDRVHVSVDRGWVTLKGKVNREYEKSCAEADARMTSGVAGVTNEIIFEP